MRIAPKAGVCFNLPGCTGACASVAGRGRGGQLYLTVPMLAYGVAGDAAVHLLPDGGGHRGAVHVPGV